MVKETRQIVEDYILYKIHSTNVNIDCYPHKVHCSITAGLPLTNGSNKVLVPLQNPTKLNLAVRSMADKFEKAYKSSYPELVETIRNANISAKDVQELLSKVSKLLIPLPVKTFEQQINRDHLFADYLNQSKNNVHWGHVIGLLVCAGLLAVRAFECEVYKAIDEILIWVTSFFDTELSIWLAKQGGWADFYEWSKATVGRHLDNKSVSCASSCSSSMPTAMSVGIIAACVGIGVLFLSKK